MRITPRAASGLIVWVCIALGGCSKKSAEPEPPAETPAPVAVATPPPPAAAPVASISATPAPKRLTPAGTFYLLVKKSVETADGVTGFKPGTLVKQEADGSFTAEGRKLDVRPNEITNDLDIAARYAGADAQRQMALRQAATTPAAPPASTPAPVAKPAGPSIAQGQRSPAALEASSALGSNHTMTRDGWLWQKDATGTWKRIKPLR